MSHSNSDECFLLHQRSYGETSLIVDVFTRNNGKMSLIAKGAKKPRSKFFGYLVPFYKLNITYSGRSELKTLTSIDRNLLGSGNTMTKTSYSLLYINELLIKLLPKDAKQEDLFGLYEIFLDEVNLNKDIEKSGFTMEESEKGYKNFTVIQCNIESIEWLYLAAKGHRRIRFDLKNNKNNWLVP